jgi:hypothetical protein
MNTVREAAVRVMPPAPEATGQWASVSVNEGAEGA